MEKSQSLKNIASAIMQFHLKVTKIAKDANNPFFKSRYASLSNILDAIDIPLAESGLSFTQFPTGEHGLTTILMHSESGEYLQSTYEMRPVKDDPQGRGSVITYQRRYALASVLGLNIDDDDDANQATHGSKEPKTETKTNGEQLPWLNKGTKEFDGAVQKLSKGTTTIDKIEKVFKLSKEVKQLLINAKDQLVQS